MKKILIACTIIISLVQCSLAPSDSNKKKEQESTVLVEFGKVEKVNTSILSDITFIKLETNEQCLIDQIKQIEVFNEYIYILSSSGVCVFGMDGKYVNKLQLSGNGPGEFISPYSCWIDAESIFILDRQLSRLLRYNIETFKFVESIVMPFDSPISFAKMPNSNWYIYYYPLRPERGIVSKQVFIADKAGNVKTRLLEGTPSGKILHGNNSNFYFRNGEINFYPYFSTNIYSINSDSLSYKYTLSFKENKLPDQELFVKYENSGDIMKEVLLGDHKWIRLIYIYETDENLVVKYYIEKDFYISVLDKKTKKNR